MTVITIASSFGLRGSFIGATLARSLDIPFVDRAIPRAISRELGVPIDEVMAQDNKAATGLWRLISAMAVVPDISGTEVAAHGVGGDERAFVERTEKLIREAAQTTGGVFVGRAGALVLRDVPGALHVRLTGPKDARIQAYAALKKLPLKEAREVVETNDKARLAYGKAFYRTNLADNALYDLVIDQTRFTEHGTVDLVTAAVRARAQHG
ncbi:cytidylate kinase-like family protein [Cumulibacter manganitolerans]|uniref:cytidylate kinase-like family protein n=1 Tax=Cumulibacter manganitolerans TaxID=1884992 RepID=UPI00129545CA|nr:cytidylate kinase-like family protein [Cumulibacter manganitolerans]